MSKLLEPQMLLDWARDLGRDHPFLDIHVHPFDVLTEDVTYQRNEGQELLFSKARFAYHEPVPDLRMEPQLVSPALEASQARAFLLASRFKYAHTGAKVIADQLGAVGLSGALLLPVARSSGSAERMLDASERMFLDDHRLSLACPFPIGIRPAGLAEFFRTARDRYGICAIKLHPNLAGVDPLMQIGHDLIEATLEAAGALGLPVIVHGGRSSALSPSAAAEYGMLSRLETINWGISTSPVVLAHAVCYELTEEETRSALCKVDALFEKYPNLLADVSNLEPLCLRLVLKNISRDRLLFGSDALYNPIWKAWLGFLSALQEVSASPDDDLICIASFNSVRCFSLCPSFTLMTPERQDEL